MSKIQLIVELEVKDWFMIVGILVTAKYDLAVVNL